MDVYTLDVKFTFHGKEDTLHPVILHDNYETILVDCGYPGFMPLIEKAAQHQGFSLHNLTGIIITHHDIDHMGGLYEIKEKYPSLKIYAFETEAKYINGKEKPLRLQQAENIYSSLPEDQKPGALQFQESLKNVRPVAVDVTFSAGEKPTCLKGVCIVHTPGHLPGHISLYVEERKTFIAADALVIEEGDFNIANPNFAFDLKEAVASVIKIRAYAIDTMICYHGGMMEKDIQHKLDKLITKYNS